jgi:3',5'-cyclic AMP phosphodiesterase CpdA
MFNDPIRTRREALKCMAMGAGTLFTVSGGVLSAVDLASAATTTNKAGPIGKPLFIQISDTHIGFKKDANPDVLGTLNRTIERVNSLPHVPSLLLHTGDITHLSKPEEFDIAQQMLGKFRSTEVHTTPGEHDVADANVSEYFDRFGAASARKGYYSFDHEGVHFVGLINVLQAKDGGAGALGDAQLAWVKDDLKGRTASTPIVVFAHMPLWPVYEPWGWTTTDAAQLTPELRRFGSVTVLNGHIHQIAQKVEGNIRFHTARSTAFPQPAPGNGPGPGPLKVPAEQLSQMLGVTNVSLLSHPRSLVIADEVLA